jgi:type I restriction enzyme, S subunit
MTWRRCKLGDIVTLKRGHDLPERSRQDGDVPVVSSSGVTGYHKEAKAAPPGVVTGRYGTLGEVYYIEQDYWPLNTALYVVDFKGNNPRFVAYFLKNALRGYRSDKAAVPGIDRNVLHELNVNAPGKSEQLAIVSILSVYDELIANNTRRIELLEKSARLLFGEWFVRLRYPGLEHDKLIDGVPEGWAEKTLADLCAGIDYGYTASASEEPVGPKYLRITDIVPNVIDWAAVPYCVIDETKEAKFRLKEGDIVIARTGATVGYAKRLNKRHPACVFASYLVRLRLKPDVDNCLVGVFVESDMYKSVIQSRIGGAAQPNANAKVLTSVPILLPPTSLQRAYSEFVEPLFDQREALQSENARLARARDLLLPRLMDGRIEV